MKKHNNLFRIISFLIIHGLYPCLSLLCMVYTQWEVFYLQVGDFYEHNMPLTFMVVNLIIFIFSHKLLWLRKKPGYYCRLFGIYILINCYSEFIFSITYITIFAIKKY